MADAVAFGARLDSAMSTTGAGGARITRAEYDQLREHLPFGSGFQFFRGLREWGMSEQKDKLWAAVADNDTYESFCKNYQSGGASGGTGGGGLRKWENQ